MHAPLSVSHTIVAAFLLWSCPLPAQVSSQAASPESPQLPSFEPRLHQSIKACGKKRVKRARKLPEDQLAWMLQWSHGIYAVELDGQLVMSLELLSTPSLRNCDVVNDWDQRETSIRVTYYLADGSQKVVLSNFSKDHIFFNEKPEIYPHIGKALLKGTTVQGARASRWLELERLRTLYEEALVARAFRPLLTAERTTQASPGTLE